MTVKQFFLNQRTIVAHRPARSSTAQTLEQFIASLSPGFWLQADYDQNADYVDGAAIGTGYDASVNQLDVTQGTTAAKPTYKTNIINGLPVFRFDGGDTLTKASVLRSKLAGASEGSFIFVLKQTGSNAANVPWFWGDATVDKILGIFLTYFDSIYFDFSNQTSGQGRIGPIAQPVGWDDNWHLVEFYKNPGGTGDIIIDGVSIVSGAAQTRSFGADNSMTLAVGSFNGASLNFAGDVYMELIVPTSLSSQNRNDLRKMINDKLGFLTISLTTPKAYQVFQRSGTTGTISISGSIAGGMAPRTIEASWNGGAWTEIAWNVTGAFSGTLAGNQGQGTLSVRIKGLTSISTSVAYVGIGDIFIIGGQSNAVGQGTNNQFYSHATLRGALFGNDYAWKNLLDPTDSTSGQVDAISQDPVVGGSIWPLIATKYMTDLGIPVAFVPCALTSTSIQQWLPGTDHFDRTTLYGSMAYRAMQTGCRAVLWWQGEYDAVAGTPEAIYNSRLDTLADAVYADLGVYLIPCKIQNCAGGTDETAVNNAIGTAWIDNPHVLPGPDLHGLNTDDTYHLQSDVNLQSAATLWWAAIKSAFGW